MGLKIDIFKMADFKYFQANTLAKSGEVNDNFLYLLLNRIIGLESGKGTNAKSEFDIGDSTVITGGSLVGDILMRDGGVVKIYNSAGTLLRTVNLDSATFSAIGQAYLSKPIFVKDNATDSDHDLDFGVGNFTFNDGSGQAYLLSALTKRFDSTFAIGTDAGGMAQGVTMGADLPYHIFAISNEAGSIVDIIADSDIDGSNVLGDSVVVANSLTKIKKIAAFHTDANSDIRNGIWNFANDGSYVFIYKNYLLEFNGTFTSTTQFQVKVPPRTEAILNVNLLASTSNTIRFYSNFLGSNSFFRLTSDASKYNVSQFRILVDDSQHIGVTVTGTAIANTTLVYINGWIDSNNPEQFD